jgi:hypothetical protein
LPEIGNRQGLKKTAQRWYRTNASRERIVHLQKLGMGSLPSGFGGLQCSGRG